MTGDPKLYEQYPKDFFDLVIVDECHRGGAAEGSNWQGILDHFDAVKLGLTATPRRDENADSYEYFGDPVYEYSLKQGVEDGFLSPFKTQFLDFRYLHLPDDDEVLMGEPEQGKTYTSSESTERSRSVSGRKRGSYFQHMNRR